jgi:Family of unknown function (DUF5317)
VFMLYALPVGFVLGLVLGGRPGGLATIQFRWAPVMLAGLLVQVVLFSDPVTAWIGAAGPPIYVASTIAVAAAVIANYRITGMPLIGLGAASNLAAIVANGGYMPAAPGALAALGRAEGTSYSNSAVVSDPALAPLTDLFAMPTWLPFANVFSVGDILIAVGVVVVIVAAMRRGPLGAGDATIATDATQQAGA